MVDFKKQRVATLLVVGECVADNEHLMPGRVQLESSGVLQGLPDCLEAQLVR
jgi:hypothetical protein